MKNVKTIQNCGLDFGNKNNERKIKMTDIKQKYIIKNCPAYTAKGEYYNCWCNQDTWCQNINDCLLKKVVNICKKYNAVFSSQKILELLEMKEV